MNNIESAPRALAVVMTEVNAQTWKTSEPPYIHLIYTSDGRKFGVTSRNLQAATEYLQMKVPPLRASIRPDPLDTTAKQPRRSLKGSGRKRDKDK